MSEVDATDPGPTAAERRGHGTSTGARPGDTLGGRFLLRQVLGYGGTGTVFAALDTVVGQKVAVKLLHPDLHDATTRERLRREVRAARHGHPNLVAVYDLHEDAEHVWLSMELVEGESLKQRLAERRRLEPDEVTGIGRQIAAALAHLHGLGLVHRDLKPGNILLGADASARLCDMGLTRPIEQGTTLTLTEMVVGTPAYMAPEQGLGRGLTAASDVYGLGMTLYQALTGTVPLTSETAVATLTRRQREAPPPLLRARPDAPRWLGRLLARMLEPRPGDRPTAAAVRRALETRRMWPRPRRRTLVAGAAAAALTTAVAVAAPLLLQRETVRFEVGGTTVHGLDRDGRRTWSHELPAPMTMSLEADLDGDGRAELVASGRPAPEDFRSLQPSRSFVDVVTLRGRLLTRMVPEEMVPLWSFPYRVDLMPLVRAFDLDGDGREELVASCQHIHFFPTVVIVYWPRWDRWEIALNHPGHLSAIAPGTGDGSPGLRVFGINNDLGHTPVYGEIALLPPGPRLREGSFSVGLGSPPEGRLGSSSSASWQVYVPLDEAVRGVGRPADRIVSRPDGFLELGQGAGDGFRLDRFFNPVPGPNAGRDLRAQRLAFMDGLYLIAGAGSAIRPAGVRERLDRAARAAGPLLDEAPYRLILAVVGARALATASDLEGGLALLYAPGVDQADADILYLRGHLEGIGGDLPAARSTVLELLDGGATSRSHHDGRFLLLEIASRTRDRDLAAAAAGLFSISGGAAESSRSQRTALWARAHLWWDECSPIDEQLRSSQLAADGDALGCLARWRRGRTAADDVELMTRSVELNRDGALLGRVALAAAHLGRSDAGAALRALEAATTALEPAAKIDFIAHQNLALARSLEAVALAEAGEGERAAALAAELAREQPADLLPGILAREVLARSAL